MRGILLAGVLGVLCALAIGWVVVAGVPWRRQAEPAVSATSATAVTSSSADTGRKIRANLFYVSEDGLRLVAVDREVAYGQDTAAQARLLVEEQLRPAPPPLAQAIPAGTSLRAFFLTGNGDAFVDLTSDASTRHTGGSLDELFSVYAIVNVVTVNLPAVARVQILVDGKEVDTLAGHVDLRGPLQKSMKWVAAPSAMPQQDTATP